MSKIKKYFKNLSSVKGFTLVELLVVIAIIGVLSTLILLQLGTARAKARDAKRISDVSQIRTAIELYFDDNNGQFPTALTIANLGAYFSTPTIPVDPVTGASYFYAYNPAATPTQFHLWTELERNNAAALRGDFDINSTGWSGNAIDASTAGTEACTAAYSAGAARDCIYDVGQR